MKRQDLVRCLENRGAALLRLDARVRCPPDQLKAIVGDSLPRADDVAVGPGAFEDQRDIVLGREGAD